MWIFKLEDLSLWCKSFIEDQNPFINGDGETSRDFIYVEDIVDANILVANSNIKGSHVFNVGSGENITLNNLFDLMRNKFNKLEVEPIYKDFRPGDIRHSLSNLTKIKKYLGYQVNHDIHDGLDKTIEWYKKKLK